MILKRRRADGTMAYQARISVNGVRSASTFDSLSEAQSWERKQARKRGRRTSRETAGSFAERWLDDYPVSKSGPTRDRRKKPGTLDVYRQDLAHFIRELGHLPLDGIDRPTARRLANTYPRSASVARNMLNDALDDGLVEVNPFVNMRLPQSKGRRDNRVLEPDQVARLADSARELYGPEYGALFAGLITFSAYAGPRLGSVLALGWGDVDLDARTVRFREAKFDQPYTAILVPEALNALREVERFPRFRLSGVVFPSKRERRMGTQTHYGLWNPVRTHAHLPGVHWHELRHFCAHHFYVTLGFSDEEAGAQLGHSSGEQVRRTYGHARQGILERLRRGTEPVAPLRERESESA